LYFKKHSSSRYFHLNPGISVVFQSISHHTWWFSWNFSSDAQPTLFVTNIPLSFNQSQISDIFSCFGPVAEVNFLDNKLPSSSLNLACFKF
jgi:RNA recognition motif-containing protein